LEGPGREILAPVRSGVLTAHSYEKDTENLLCIFLALVWGFSCAGIGACWSRYGGLLEQVWKKAGDLRPSDRVEGRFAALVPREKPHLRQERAGPAPSFPSLSLGNPGRFLWNVLDNHYF
jgi:hypothetical protein